MLLFGFGSVVFECVAVSGGLANGLIPLSWLYTLYFKHDIYIYIYIFYIDTIH